MTQFGGYVMLGIYVRTSRDDTESSIEQQINAGKVFAEANKLDFDVYTDEGKSGYKIGKEDDDLFRNRPGFTQLLKDIKDKKIDSVWVWEQSRLSRNQYASAKIFYEFERKNIKVYVKDSLYDFKDSNTKLMRGILSSIAEYERELIVARTTRGHRDKIDKGERSYGRLYGYKATGRDEKGFTIWAVVQSEIENIKYGYKRILEGATLRQLTLELYNSKKIKDKYEALSLSLKWHRILNHFDYTGYSLNTKGLSLFRDFKEFRIENLSALHDTKYYKKSAKYTEKIISIEKWIKVTERLQLNSKIRLDYRTNKASKDLATGIITCGECEQKYYSYTHINKKNGNEYRYEYYKHFARMSNIIKCSQKKSIAVGNINEIFKIFYFLNYTVYDNTQETYEETIRLLKLLELESEERIKAIDKEIKQSERNKIKFENALDTTNDTGAITTLAKRISVEEEKHKDLMIEKSKKTIELEKLKITHSRTETENMYYNVKDKINEFFNAKNTERKRSLLVQVVRKCIITGSILLIDTGYNLYIFDTELKFIFRKKQLESLANDEDYKFYYTELKSGKSKIAYDDDKEMNDKKIDAYTNIAYVCENITVDACSVKTDSEYIDEHLKDYNIKYDYSKLNTVLLFEEVGQSENIEDVEEDSRILF